MHSDEVTHAVLQSALIAGIESQLLGTVAGLVGTDESMSAQALLAFTYMALFLTIGATMEAVVLTQELSGMTVRTSRDRNLVSENVQILDLPISSLLSRFNGKRKSWRVVLAHCTSDKLSTSSGQTDCVQSYSLLWPDIFRSWHSSYCTSGEHSRTSD